MTHPGGRSSGPLRASEAYAQTLQGMGHSPVSGADSKDPLLGQELNSYRIIKKLGQGGMGVVYLGEHVLIGRKAAVKVLKPELCQDQETVERFYQEGRTVAQIAHENIIDVYDFGKTDEGQVFFVMELLEGETLAERLKRGAIPFQEAYPIIVQIAEALGAAHEKGIVHRDLKPENVYLIPKPKGPPKVKVLDFGLAKFMGKGSVRERLTQTGAILGTPHYMSPEQIDDGEIDGRADIYSLGAVMYEMFSGQPPFTGKTVGELLKGHLFVIPPRIQPDSSLQVPPKLARVVARALEKKPQARYATMRALLEDIDAAASGRELAAAPITRPTFSAIKPMRRAAPYLALTIGGAILTSLLVIFVLKPWENAAPPPPSEPQTQQVEAPSDDALREEALALLRKALKDAEGKIRAAGARSLGEVRDAQSAPLLTPLLADSEIPVQESAAWALGEIGESAALAPLKEARDLVKDDPARALAFDKALLRLHSEEARERLLAQLSSEEPKIRLMAALALAEEEEPAAEDTLRDLRTSESALVTEHALEVLSSLMLLGDKEAQTRLLALLSSPDEGARLAAAEVLARVGDDSGYEAARASLEDKTSKYRLIAARVLVLLGDYSGYEVFTEALSSSDAALRREGAKGLGLIAETTALPLLRPLLEKDPDALTRMAAAVAILDILGLSPMLLAQNSEDWLKQALLSPDAETRAQAAAALASVAPEKALPLLTQALKDEDAAVRKEAAQALGKLGDAAAVSALAEATEDQSEGVSVAAATALGEIGGSDARAALEKIPGDSAAGLAAAGALAKLGDQEALELIEKASRAQDAATRKDALKAAAGAGLVDLLKKGLKDKQADVRFEAAKGLAALGDPSGAAVLSSALEGKDAAKAVEARGALASLGLTPDGSAKPIWPADADEAARKATVDAAAALPTDEALTLLRRALKDTSAQVRGAAVAALSKLETKAPAKAKALYRSVIKEEKDRTVREAAKAALARLELDGPASQNNPKEEATPTSQSPAQSNPVTEPIPLTLDPKQEDARLLIATAETYTASGRYDAAIAQLKKAQAIKADIRIDFEMGEVYRKWGARSRNPKDQISRWKRARAAYERYLARGGQGSRAEKARRALDEIALDLAALGEK